jgi:tetratricopeptide (TPR) repeat protein
MSSPALVTQLERSSRISALLAVAGAAVVLGALLLSYRELRSVQLHVASLRADSAQLVSQNQKLRTETAQLRQELGGAREALAASRSAIAAFHQRDYDRAVRLYDQAIKADSGNAYLLNLRAYALFKQGRLADALAGQELSMRADSGYAWGYFDLARFECAAERLQDARRSIDKALALRPGLRTVMADDSEFQRLCARVLH